MADTIPGQAAPRSRVSAYGWYALLVLVLVYVVNFVDRQIISILAQDIKHDLHLQDAQIGFLYGTAFAVFYALFGIPLGRLADSWYRGRLIAIGLGAKRTFGERRAADVAEADEQDRNSHGAPPCCQSPPLC